MMPYVPTYDRQKVDDKIDELLELIKDHQKPAGMSNYIITRILSGIMKPWDGWNYSSLNSAIGVVECAKLELYRRLVGPYEDLAIAKNGDIEEYK